MRQRREKVFCITFKQYLDDLRINLDDVDSLNEFKTNVFGWLILVKKDLQTYIDQLPLSLLEHTLTSFLKKIEKLHGNLSNDKLVDRIDADFQRLLKYCYAQFIRYNKIYPSDLLIRDFPLEKNVSGVKFTCRIVLADGLVKEFGVCGDHFSCGRPGDNSLQKELKQYVKAHVGKIKWLNKSLKDLGLKHLDIVKHSKPHAEDHWFIRHSEELVDFCREKLRKIRQPEIWDELPLTHFASAVRIEFFSTTSCCVECWPYFRALRVQLNQLGIYVPILIFGYKPYQQKDQYQSIFYVSMSGEYCHPGLQWAEESLSLIPQERLSAFNLNALYQQYFELEVHGRSIIPLLQENVDLAENFVTYIAKMIDHPHTNVIFQHWAIPFLLTAGVAVGRIDTDQVQLAFEKAARENHIDLGLLDLLFADIFQENLEERLRAVAQPRKSIWFFGFLFSRSLAYASVDTIEQMDQERGYTQAGRNERKLGMADENNNYNAFSGLYRISMVSSLHRLAGNVLPSDEEQEAAARVWDNIAIRRELPEIEDRIHPEEGDDAVIDYAKLYSNMRN